MPTIAPTEAYERTHALWTALVPGVPAIPGGDGGEIEEVGARPAKPFATIALPMLPGTTAQAGYGPYVGGTLERPVMMSWRASIQVFGPAGPAAVQAFCLALRNSGSDPDTQAALETAGLEFGGIATAPTNTTIGLETIFETRARCEVDFNVADSLPVTVKEVTDLEIELDFRTAAGEQLEDPNPIVEVPIDAG